MEYRLQQLQAIVAAGEGLRCSLWVGHETDDVAAVVGNRRD